MVQYMALVHRRTSVKYFLKADLSTDEDEDKDDVLLLPGVQVRRHHLHEVFGGLVSIAWHVHHGEGSAHSVEVHLLGVTLTGNSSK